MKMVGEVSANFSSIVLKAKPVAPKLDPLLLELAAAPGPLGAEDKKRKSISTRGGSPGCGLCLGCGASEPAPATHDQHQALNGW